MGSQYEIVRLLGRGGMGAVFLARETSLDRLVAIKVLPPETSGKPEVRERFRREARTAARLTHPGIVPLHSIGEGGGVMYYVMGYVRGEPLSARLRREGRLSPEDVRRILSDLAEALDFAHRRGVIHRDVKPDNVILDDESGRPMLADFGIAKARDAGSTLTSLGSVVGTPTYISPEQASGTRELDGRSDLYSLGVMGYQMLSGRPPFSGSTPRDVLMQHLTRSPPPLAETTAGAPPDLVDTITRCLAKDPDARWADGRALMKALGAPRGGGDELPDALEEVADFGVTAVLVCVLAAFTRWFEVLWKGHLGPIAEAILRVTEVGAPIVALVAFYFAKRAHDQGFGWRRVFGVALRQPTWWRWWYPPSLRRPGDVWRRLPAEVLRARGWLGVSVLAALATAPPLLFAFAPDQFGRTEYRTVAQVWAFVLGAILVAAVSAGGLADRWLRQRGLGGHERDRLLWGFTGPTSFWARPHVAALLRAPEARPTSTPPGSRERVTDLLHDLLGGAGKLTGASRAAGDQAAAVARDLVSRIEKAEHEIERLRQDVDSEEVERVRERLDALGHARDGEGEARRQMRRLLTEQRDLARQLSGRLDEEEARRASLLELLRVLWSEVRALQSPGTPTPAGAADRLAALCTRVALEAKGDVPASERVTLPDPAKLSTLDVRRRRQGS